MFQCHRSNMLDSSVVPTTEMAVSQYRACGGRITESSHFGRYPIANSIEKCQWRDNAFHQHFPQFNTIFYDLVNRNDTTFKNALIYYIDLTYRLSSS